MRPLDARKVELRDTTLIEASAGTGKTYTITTLYLRLILEEGLEVANVLVITYTRAATGELRDRIRNRLAEALRAFESGAAADDDVLQGFLDDFDSRARRTLARQRLGTALSDFDSAAILTIHGFCQRALREYAFESRSAFDVELLVDQSALLQEVAADHWSKVVECEESIVVEFLQRLHPRIERWVAVARYGAEADPPHVIPSRAIETCEPVGDRERTWRAALARAEALWREHDEDVIELLTTSDALNRNSYRVGSIETTWRAETDALFAKPISLLADRNDRKELTRLGSETLRQKTKKGKQGDEPKHPFFDACEELGEATDALYEIVRARQIGIERDLIVQTELCLEERKREAARQSYDDLLTQMAGALDGSAGRRFKARLRSEYQAALVDEFQDTDQLQYQIVRKVWHEARLPLFLIGDPKQAIYAFRGADVYAYLNARKDAGERVYTLNVNWRSDPGLIEAIESLFLRHAGNAFANDAIEFAHVEPRPGSRNAISSNDDTFAASFDLLFLERDDGKVHKKEWVNQHLPARVAADIARLLASGARVDDRPVSPGDVAVLCRTNDQTQRMVDALREAGVTAALLGTASVFDSDEALELERVLEAVAEPRSLARIRTALSTRIFGVDAQQFQRWPEEDPVWDEWLETFDALAQRFTRDGFIRTFHTLLRDHGVQERLLATAGGERRLANLFHLAELAERAAQTEHLGPAGTVQWLANMRLDAGQRGNAVGEEGELRLESDRDAVRVVTIHKSKGLEYPIVYCPFLFASAKLSSRQKARVRFHDASGDPERVGDVTLDLGSSELREHIELAEIESLGEAMRMLYVALTRAKHRCSVVWGAVRDAQHSSLFGLLHPELPPGRTLSQISDSEMLEDLEAFAGEGGRTRTVRSLGDDVAPPARSRAALEFDEGPRIARVMDTRWRHSSFSQLAASERHAAPPLPPLRAEGADRDEIVAIASVGDAPEATATEPDETLPFASLAPGARTGVLLHSLLEHLDFESPVGPQFADALTGELDTHAVAMPLREPLARDFERVLASPIDSDGLHLGALPQRSRLDEAEFLIPVGDRSVKSGGLIAAELAHVFRGHTEDPIAELFAEEYAPRVERLRFDALVGFMRGFVDLVFEWRGRFYIVDYKSNRLGSDLSAYQADALIHPMMEHHYVLQYHLYTVAMDRYLAGRVPGYDYETHFGGVYYLFLRGMVGPASTPSGIFRHRPSAASIAALSALFERASEVAA